MLSSVEPSMVEWIKLSSSSWLDEMDGSSSSSLEVKPSSCSIGDGLSSSSLSNDEVDDLSISTQDVKCL